MTEDHTDKSLLERAEELLPRLRYGAAWTRDMLTKGGRITALNVAPTMDDAAQVISDLKTALQTESAENERLSQVIQREHDQDCLRVDAALREAQQELEHRERVRFWLLTKLGGR